MVAHHHLLKGTCPSCPLLDLRSCFSVCYINYLFLWLLVLTPALPLDYATCLLPALTLLLDTDLIELCLLLIFAWLTTLLPEPSLLHNGYHLLQWETALWVATWEYPAMESNPPEGLRVKTWGSLDSTLWCSHTSILQEIQGIHVPPTRLWQ